MNFVFAGFHQVGKVRQYRFDAIGEDRSRREVTVGADLNLICKYKIPVQELPLLCLRLLEGRQETASFIFSEADMVQYQSERAVAQAAAMQKRRRPPRPTDSKAMGMAWRGSKMNSDG